MKVAIVIVCFSVNFVGFDGFKFPDERKNQETIGELISGGFRFPSFDDEIKGPPGHDEFSPGFDGIKGPGFDGIKGPGFDGSKAPGFDGIKGPGFDGVKGSGFVLFSSSATTPAPVVSTLHDQCGISQFYRQRRPREEKDESRVINKTMLAPPAKGPKMMMLDNDEFKEKARIVNGIESKRGSFPWQVSIHLNHPKWGPIGHWCGGVLIHPRWVLTAAHCISNEAFNFPFGPMWTIVFGEHDRSIDEGSEVKLKVEKVIIHDRFKEYHNDLALMKLAAPVTMTDHIRLICISDDVKDEDFLGVRCIASGWGQSKYGGKLNTVLHQAELPVVDNKHCKKIYGMMYNIPIHPYHLCAGPLTDGGIGTCVGDSGGPLQCNLKDGRWYLAGITSFGSGCAKPGYPDVFTRLSHYLPWIRGKIRSHS